MKKKVLMSLVLLAIVGTSVVFAQQPTLDKLKFTIIGASGGTDQGKYEAQPLNNNISGSVVFPTTYNNIPVVRIQGFGNCGEITSVTIPAGVVSNGNSFINCAKLTSVTFQGSDWKNLSGSPAFPGDLDAKYKAGGAGTYTRSGNTWTKEGGFSLNGTWTRSDGMKITIAENGQNITITDDKPNNGGKLNDTYAKR